MMFISFKLLSYLIALQYLTCDLYYRNGLSLANSKFSFATMMNDDDQTSRQERCFRLWINSLGIATYVNNLFEDVRTG